VHGKLSEKVKTMIWSQKYLQPPIKDGFMPKRKKEYARITKSFLPKLLKHQKLWSEF